MFVLARIGDVLLLSNSRQLCTRSEGEQQPQASLTFVDSLLTSQASVVLQNGGFTILARK